MGTKICVVIACVCCLALCASAQQVGTLNCTVFDSNTAVIDSARSRILYGLRGIDRIWLYPGENGSLGAMDLSVELNVQLPPARAIAIKGIRLLAWHEKKIGPLLHTRSALIWSHYLNADSAAEWAWLVLSSDVDNQRWTASQRDDQPLMRYSHAPTNEDVQAFLDQLQGIEGRMLSYNKKGMYDWKGVKITFMGGEVCKEAWEEVIGEKPLTLFPKLK